MKSFKEVLEASKQQVLEARKYKIENEKVALLEAIKSQYMITCKLKELDKKKQHQVLNMLLEYWSPKTGINRAGIKYLNEGAIAINENSSDANIKLFAQKEIRDNIIAFQNAFMAQRGKDVVSRLQENIEYRTHKNVQFDQLFEMALTIVNEKIKQDNM